MRHIASVVRLKYMAFRWWCLRGEIEARGGGDVVTSLTTSNEEIAPQSPPARRVACDAPPSVSRALLSDVTASPASRPLTSDGAAHATKSHVFRTHYTSDAALMSAERRRADRRTASP